jgi:hypothetical protein
MPLCPTMASYPPIVIMLPFAERVMKPSELPLPEPTSRLLPLVGIAMDCTGLDCVAVDGRYSNINTGAEVALNVAEPSPYCDTITLPGVKDAACAQTASRDRVSRLPIFLMLDFISLFPCFLI